LLPAAQVAEGDAVMIVHRLLCTLHERSPETHPSHCIGDQDTAHAGDRHALVTYGDLAAGPPRMPDHSAVNACVDVHIVRCVAIRLFRSPLSVLIEVLAIE